MSKHLSWRAIKSPHEERLLRLSDPKSIERCRCFLNTRWNTRYREFSMTIITTKQFPARFPTKALLIAEAERRTEFIFASNPKRFDPSVLDDVLDALLGDEWRHRAPPTAPKPSPTYDECRRDFEASKKKKAASRKKKTTTSTRSR